MTDTMQTALLVSAAAIVNAPGAPEALRGTEQVPILANVTAWIGCHQPLLQQVGAVSLVVLAITLIAFPLVVINLPEDYFTRERREPAARTRKHPLLWGILTVFKNLLGVLFILVGIALLVLPGQGAVTILIGLALTNFPGKYNLECRIACRPAVVKTLNRIRELAGRPPLRMPKEAEGHGESDGHSRSPSK